MVVNTNKNDTKDLRNKIFMAIQHCFLRFDETAGLRGYYLRLRSDEINFKNSVRVEFF